MRKGLCSTQHECELWAPRRLQAQRTGLLYVLATSFFRVSFLQWGQSDRDEAGKMKYWMTMVNVISSSASRCRPWFLTFLLCTCGSCPGFPVEKILQPGPGVNVKRLFASLTSRSHNAANTEYTGFLMLRTTCWRTKWAFRECEV